MNAGSPSFLEELKRRKVVRVLSVYAAVSYAVAEVADLVFPRLGLPDWTITLVIAILLVGIPIVIVLAWAFDVTEKGIVRTGRTLPTRSAAGWLSLKAILLVAVLIALGAGAGWFAGRGSSPEPAQDVVGSIGVLPFVDMSPAGDMEYFGDGMAEELLNLLAKLPNIKVAGRTSSFSFKGKDTDLRSIGEALEVVTILEGSVRRSGNRIRITAQLIRANDQSHLWSDTFERGFDEDIFDVQDEIAGAIVRALQPELTGADTPSIAAQRGTQNADAYNAHLRGRFQWYRRTREGVLGSIESFQQAVELDPNYARAYAGLSDAYAISSNFGWRRSHDVMPLARKAANRALELDPLLAEAHTSMGAVLGWYDWDFEKSNRAYRRAIELDPANALAHYWFALNLDYTNRKSDARAQHDIALRLDPLALQLRNGLANHLQFWGETDAAIRVYEESLRIDPAFHNARRWLGLTYLQAGRPEESLATLDDLPEGFSDDSGVRGWAYALLGQSEKATQVLSEARSETAVDLVYIAGAYAELGLMDEAFGVLQHGIDERMYPLLQVVFIPPSARLRADPRFNDVVTAIGLQEYWPRTQVHQAWGPIR